MTDTVKRWRVGYETRRDRAIGDFTIRYGEFEGPTPARAATAAMEHWHGLGFECRFPSSVDPLPA
jgi:hypothetical protein